MIWRFLGVLALALLGAAPLAAEVPLKRLTLRHDLLGWEAVGRVETGDGGYCTGTLIAPDRVLTAAHCVTGPKKRDLGGMRFRAGLRDGKSIADSRVAAAIVHPDYRIEASGQIDNFAYDVAYLILAEPISVAQAAPFGIGRLAGAGRAVSIVSYGRGRDAALSWEDGCAISGRRTGLMAFSCNVTFGSSGAPVFDRSGGRARIVSLVGGGGQSGGRVLAFGPDLADVLAPLDRSLRLGEGIKAAPVQSAPPRFGSRATGARRLPGGGASGARFIRPDALETADR